MKDKIDYGLTGVEVIVYDKEYVTWRMCSKCGKKHSIDDKENTCSCGHEFSKLSSEDRDKIAYEVSRLPVSVLINNYLILSSDHHHNLPSCIRRFDDENKISLVKYYKNYYFNSNAEYVSRNIIHVRATFNRKTGQSYLFKPQGKYKKSFVFDHFRQKSRIRNITFNSWILNLVFTTEEIKDMLPELYSSYAEPQLVNYFGKNFPFKRFSNPGSLKDFKYLRNKNMKDIQDYIINEFEGATDSFLNKCNIELDKILKSAFIAKMLGMKDFESLQKIYNSNRVLDVNTRYGKALRIIVKDYNKIHKELSKKDILDSYINMDLFISPLTYNKVHILKKYRNKIYREEVLGKNSLANVHDSINNHYEDIKLDFDEDLAKKLECCEYNIDNIYYQVVPARTVREMDDKNSPDIVIDAITNKIHCITVYAWESWHEHKIAKCSRNIYLDKDYIYRYNPNIDIQPIDEVVYKVISKCNIECIKVKSEKK